MLFPWISQVAPLLDRAPTVGQLLDLCEENYGLLLEMAPQLRRQEGLLKSARPGHMDLYLEVLEQTPYTTVVHLTYYFSHQQGQVPDPDAVLRVYHDAAQVEVVDLRQSALPLVAGYHYPSLLNKWKVQLFLSKCRATSSNLGAAGACSENHREYIHVGSASASLPPKFSDQAPAPLFNSLRPWMTSSCVEMACLLPAPGTPFQRGKGIVD